MGAGLPLGRIFGVRVQLHWSAVIAFGALVFVLSQTISVATALVATIAFAASILAHELGHALVARQFGVQTEGIYLWALGGVARLDREAPTARAEGAIAVAGPMVSLVVAIAMAVLGFAITDPGLADWRQILWWMAALNLIVAVFNMLPGSPLDGGRVLKAIRWARHGNRYVATREAATAGKVIAGVMGGGGTLLLATQGSGLWLMLTAAFLWVNATAEDEVSRRAEALDGVSVDDMAWYGVAQTHADLDVDEMLWQRSRFGRAGGGAVIDDDGQIIGFVLEHEMWAIPSERRPWLSLEEVMIPIDKTARAQRGDQLNSMLRHLHPSRPVVTIWDGDDLVGVVPPQRLRERLAAAAA